MTIVEFLPRLVPNEDAEVTTELARAFKQARHQGARPAHKLSPRPRSTAARSRSTVEPRRRRRRGSTLDADILLVAVGIAGNVENLGLEALGVELERGFIKVDDQFGDRRATACTRSAT